MFPVGTVCVKIAGRDAGQQCVVVEADDTGFVTVEGATRRRKVNVRHLERTGDAVKVKKGASHADVMKALKLEPRTSKPRKTPERPRRVRKVKPKVKKAPVKVPEEPTKTEAPAEPPEKKVAKKKKKAKKKA